MSKKPTLRLIIGLISSLIIMALMFYFFLFLNPLAIYEVNTLKWIPILIVVVSMLVSGALNRDTTVKLLVILFIPFVVFDLFNFAYFPFIIFLFITGVLTLVVSRRHQNTTYRLLAWGGILTVFCYHLFTQPLIFETEGFGYNDSGELVNANVVWDFTEAEELKLPDHVLLDSSDVEFNMTNIKGKTQFVTFWATWCAPCIKEKPALEALKLAYQDNPQVKFIDVSFDDAEGERWKQYLESKKPLGLQLISESPKVTSRELNFAGIPMHFIVNADGSYQQYRSFEVAEKVIRKLLSTE